MRYTKCLGFSNFTALTYFIFGNVIAADDDWSHSYGRMYKWKSVYRGFDEAKISKKPIFVLVHKPGCPTCEKLKPKFKKSIRILDLSQHFVMVNVSKDDISAKDKAKFQPDGTYVPRILFFTPDGEFMEDIYNRHPEADVKCKYFYSSTSQIIDSMMLVLKRYSKEPLGTAHDKTERD